MTARSHTRSEKNRRRRAIAAEWDAARKRGRALPTETVNSEQQKGRR